MMKFATSFAKKAVGKPENIIIHKSRLGDKEWIRLFIDQVRAIDFYVDYFGKIYQRGAVEIYDTPFISTYTYLCYPEVAKTIPSIVGW